MFLIIFGGIDLPDGVFELFTRQNHVPSAAFADDADVAADAENLEAEGSARMLFFQFQYVADQYFRNVHETLPFKIVTLYYSTEKRFCKPFPERHTQNFVRWEIDGKGCGKRGILV